jgi:hypothetical protein
VKVGRSGEKLWQLSGEILLFTVLPSKKRIGPGHTLALLQAPDWLSRLGDSTLTRDKCLSASSWCSHLSPNLFICIEVKEDRNVEVGSTEVF